MQHGLQSFVLSARGSAKSMQCLIADFNCAFCAILTFSACACLQIVRTAGEDFDTVSFGPFENRAQGDAAGVALHAHYLRRAAEDKEALRKPDPARLLPHFTDPAFAQSNFASGGSQEVEKPLLGDKAFSKTLSGNLTASD